MAGLTNQANRNRPVPVHFVLGTGRCGSTLVHEVLCRHPDVRFVSNLDDRMQLPAPAARVTSSAHRLLPTWASRKGRIRFAPSEAYRAMEREIGSALSEPGRDLIEMDATPWLTKQTLEFFNRRAGDGVLVHKWTGWPRARFLHAVFPDARYVHVVRDGRAVVNSWLQMDWWRGYQGPDHWQWGPLDGSEHSTWERSNRSFPVLGAILWNKLLDAAAQAERALPEGTWLNVRYEDLLADPATTMRRIQNFFGLREVADGLERYTFDTSRTDAFRRDLGDKVVDDITSVMSGHLVQHRYILDHHSSI